MIELATMSLQVIPASPSQRLTFDVLWHLFGYICLSDPLQGPMSMSQISHRWRLVALNSPFLWCNITIRLYTSSQQHLLASAYFKRSQNVPLTLTIHATRPFESWEKKELLQPHAHRFRSLHIKANEGSLANLLWMEMDMPMPRLETFDTVISDTSRISINRKIAAIDSDENVNIIPPVTPDSLVCWDLWNPTGLTVLTLDTTHLWNEPDLDDIYHALATICHTIQHFEYKGFIASIDNDEVPVNTRRHLEFPELRSIAVLCHDNMVPLLQSMIIPSLDSLSLRDYIVYLSTIPATPAIQLMDIDVGHNFDHDGLFQVIKQWTSITRFEVFGIDDMPFDGLSPPPELLAYIKSLNQLSSLVLYGIGAATSIAYTLFMHDQAEEPLLPKLSCFLLAIVEMSPNNDLSNYLIARQRHHLPCLQKLSINLDYLQHLSDLNHIDILRENCNNIFVVADPEVGKFIPIIEENLLERLPRRE
jgi:hypothetical protein